MKNTSIIVFALVLIAVGAYLFLKKDTTEYSQEPQEKTAVDSTQAVPGSDVEEMVVDEGVTDESKTVIGSSVNGNDITAYHYGEGDTELLFVGGIHGGYAWNTVLVAYELMDYLEENPGAIPENVKVTVIPALNPDGLSEVVGTTGRFAKADVPSSQEATVPGRFNANNVDLNRNFDCDWKSSGTWQKRTVSGGSSAFSEPESKAVRDYVEAHDLGAVVVWYSAVGGVFASSCHNGISPDTLALTKLYADASGYPAYEDFDFYEITGDMVNWLAKNKIPAISVLLTTHEDVEWEKNRKGVDALLEHYTQ